MVDKLTTGCFFQLHEIAASLIMNTYPDVLFLSTASPYSRFLCNQLILYFYFFDRTIHLHIFLKVAHDLLYCLEMKLIWIIHKSTYLVHTIHDILPRGGCIHYAPNHLPVECLVYSFAIIIFILGQFTPSNQQIMD